MAKRTSTLWVEPAWLRFCEARQDDPLWVWNMSYDPLPPWRAMTSPASGSVNAARARMAKFQ